MTEDSEALNKTLGMEPFSPNATGNSGATVTGRTRLITSLEV
jgi:hypothetical protein